MLADSYVADTGRQRGAVASRAKGLGFRVYLNPNSQSFFEALYKEVIIRNPKGVGSA